MSGKAVLSLFGGNPKIDVAKKQLTYPLYGADFDPLNHHFLLVGGGGGSSSTGVPNRISLLDTSNRSEIKEVSDIELAPDEDNVSSLAIAESSAQSLLAYAGINGSVRDQEAGRNEHFRSFRVPLPAKRKKDQTDAAPPTAHVAPTQPLARTALFRAAAGPKNDCYQRILRLSPATYADGTEPTIDEKAGQLAPHVIRRVATIASGLATQNEVITFPTTETPSATQAISRVNLEKAEANDVDLTIADDTGTAFALAYATDHELFLQRLGDQKGTINSEPIKVHETQVGPKGRSKIRALRFLGSRYLLVLQNRHNKSGVELMVFKVSKDFAQVQQTLVKYLKNVKQGVGLDVCSLSKGQDGSQQFVVAVAGQDSSIQIHTIDWLPVTGMTPFKQYADIIDVHNGPITRIVFSNFIPPRLPITGQTPPQYIRLASVGVDKAVVVQTLPLKPTPATGTGKTMPRYALITPSEVGSLFYNLFLGLITLFVCTTALISFLEFRGAIPPIIGATKYLPQRWQHTYPYAHDNPGPLIPESMPAVESVIDKIKLSEATPVIEKLEKMQDEIKLADASEAIASMQSAAPNKLADASEAIRSMQSAISTASPSMQQVQDTLANLVSRQKSSDKEPNKAIIVRDLEHTGGEVSAELRKEADIVREGTLRKWESLTGHEKRTWKKKLIEAGHWTEHQGEAVLKGVFFGQLAGIVGNMVG